MLLRHSPNNACYSRIVRSASIPNNIHVTLVMLALAYLAGICSEENAPLPCVATPPTEPLTLLVLPLTVPEVRHLLGHLIWPTPCNMPRAWSRWRRCHQRRASYFHPKRRLKAG